MNEPDKFCFVISPIGARGSGTRRRANGVLRKIIRPAIEPLGYRVDRADHDRSAGMITDTMIDSILDADLVVADLSHLNPNVMYELALRHAARKPYVQMIEEGTGDLPFDVQGVRTVAFTRELDEIDRWVEDLRRVAEVAVQPPFRGPVQRAIDFRAAEESAPAPDKAILEMLRRLERSVAEVRSSALHAPTVSQGTKGPRTSRMITPPLVEDLADLVTAAPSPQALFVAIADAISFVVSPPFDIEKIAGAFPPENVAGDYWWRSFVRRFREAVRPLTASELIQDVIDGRPYEFIDIMQNVGSSLSAEQWLALLPREIES